MQNPSAVADGSGEWFEVFNPTGSAIDINGWTIEDNDFDSHVINNGGPLVTPAGGFLVLGNNADFATNGGGNVDYEFSGIFLVNGSDELVLLDDTFTEIDRVEWDNGATFPDPTGASMSLVNPSFDNNVGSNWCEASTPFGAGDLGTPGATNDCSFPALEIFQVQGSGTASTFEGQTVRLIDDVVTALGTNGFFIQTPTDRSDGDVDTSDGIFVFTGGAPSVSVGDLVDVTGNVDEFFGLTELSGSPTVVITGTGVLPGAVLFDATTPSPNDPPPSNSLERYEGMLVEVVNGTAVGPTDRFGDTAVVAGGVAPTFREPGIEFPGLPGLPVWDGNPEGFEVNADGLGPPDAPMNRLDTFSAVGVLSFSFGDYQLFPTSLSISAGPAAPVPVRGREEGEFTIGSLNLFRLFGSDSDFPQRLTKLSQYIREVLDSPDILAVQEVSTLATLQALADQISADNPAVVYTPFLEEGNDVGGIDVGFLVRDSIQVDAVTQLGKNETFIDPTDGSEDILHDRPPLLLEGRCVRGRVDFPIKVMTIHNRSLAGIDDPDDGSRVRQQRFEQANSIAQKVQDLQDADSGVRLVVIGDYNAFQFTDGFVDVVGQTKGDFQPTDNLVCQTNGCTDLVTPDLTNQVERLPVQERYSFFFRGSAEAIDHALTTESLDCCIRTVQYGRGNADAAANLIDDDTTPLRASDHDGLVLFIRKDREDHFLSYQVRRSHDQPKFEKREVFLADRFGEGDFEVKKPVALLNPADKNGEGITDPNTHLISYRVKGPQFEKFENVPVEDQFGQLLLDVKRPDRLLVPASKNPSAPPDAPIIADINLDHFLCYPVKESKRPQGDDDDDDDGGSHLPVQAFVVDQFNQPKVFDVRRPTRLCNPVDKDDEGIKNPNNQLLCYQVKPARGEPKHIRIKNIFVHDQFGPNKVDTKKERELCVPLIAP